MRWGKAEQRERERRWETGRVRGRKGREEGISNKLFTAWSVIDAQILPESRGFQFNFKSQKVQSSCRGVPGRIWVIICYPTKIMKGQFISCVFKQRRSREQFWQHPPCFHEQRNSQVHFQGPSLEQPCPSHSKMSHCRDGGSDLLCPAPSHLHRW